MLLEWDWNHREKTCLRMKPTGGFRKSLLRAQMLANNPGASSIHAVFIEHYRVSWNASCWGCSQEQDTPHLTELTVLAQGLCTCWSLCLECSSPSISTAPSYTPSSLYSQVIPSVRPHSDPLLQITRSHSSAPLSWFISLLST